MKTRPSAVLVSLVLFWDTPRVMLLTPMPSIELLTELLMELPTLMIAMTEPMPMMIPSMVRRARILFAKRPFRASMIFSPINMALHSPFSL